VHRQAEDLAPRAQALEPGESAQPAAANFEAAFLDLTLPLQLAAVRTARATSTSRLDWATTGLLHYYLAEALADRGYPAAAEHVMRAVTDPLKRLLTADPTSTAFLSDMYLIRRFHGRISLHLGRGPQALDPLRATVRSFIEHSTRLPEGLDYYESVRLYQALLHTEIAAMLAGADPRASRAFFDEMTAAVRTGQPEPLEDGIERSLRRARGDLTALWSGTAGARRDEIAGRMATRLSGPELESKVGAALVVERWSDPR
jgi:hypothetical protein